MTYRIAFFGTPDFSVSALSNLIDAGHEIVAVYTQPPRPGGRGKKIRSSPVDQFANKHKIPVLTPKSLKLPEVLKEFLSHRVDIAIVVAYGLLLPKAILCAPTNGCLNLHASLLPRWRGAAPIQRAIMAGDSESGVTVMRMEKGLDTGPICLSEKISIKPDMTAGDLHDILAETGGQLIVRALDSLSEGLLTYKPQSEEGVTYANKISKSETRIDWSDTAVNVHNHIRGLSPFPGAWFEVRINDRSERIKVLSSTANPAFGAVGRVGEIIGENLSIACGDGAVQLNSLQRAGKRPMTTQEFLRGMPLRTGDIIMESN